MLASAKSIFGHLASALADDWSLKARPEQLAPAGDWHDTAPRAQCGRFASTHDCG